MLSTNSTVNMGQLQTSVNSGCATTIPTCFLEYTQDQVRVDDDHEALYFLTVTTVLAEQVRVMAINDADVGASAGAESSDGKKKGNHLAY